MFWFERKEVCHGVGCHSGISVTNCHSPRSYCSSLALVTRMCRRTVWLLKAIISIIIFVTKNFFSCFCCRYVYSFITMVTRNGMAIPNPGFSLRDWRSHQQVPTLSSWVPPSPTHPSHRGLECTGETGAWGPAWKGYLHATQQLLSIPVVDMKKEGGHPTMAYCDILEAFNASPGQRSSQKR